MRKITRLATALGMTLLAATAQAATTGYAEELYQDFAQAAHGQVKVSLQELRHGDLSAYADQKAALFTGVPLYTITAASSALEIESLSFNDVNMKSLYLADLDTNLRDFDEAGFPLSGGQFRQFEVSIAIGKDARTHQAVEFCWADQGHCVVFDPNIEFLDSLVNGQRERRAQGWATTLRGEQSASAELPGQQQAKARCGLASHPTWTAAQITWPAYRVSYKNLLGNEIGHANIGSAQAGLRCTSSCAPAPYGYTNASSGSIIFPNSIACDFAHNQGTSGRSGKYVGKTGCSQRTVLGAKFNAEAKGVGLGVEVTIDSAGSVKLNGGAYVDTCAYF